MTSQAQMAAIVPQAFQNKVPKVPKFMIHCIPLRVIWTSAEWIFMDFHLTGAKRREWMGMGEWDDYWLWIIPSFPAKHK